MFEWKDFPCVIITRFLNLLRYLNKRSFPPRKLIGIGLNSFLRKVVDWKNLQSMFYENRTFRKSKICKYLQFHFPPLTTNWICCFSKSRFLRFRTCRSGNNENQSNPFYLRGETKRKNGKELWDIPYFLQGCKYIT